jgi:hypothetical protein
MHVALNPCPPSFLYLVSCCQVQPGAVSLLPERTPGQLQLEAARVPRPQHEVRPVPEEGEGGQGKGRLQAGSRTRGRRLAHTEVHTQLGANEATCF